MQQSIKNRIARLEAMHRPPEELWTIPLVIYEWGGADSPFRGPIIARIPARKIEPGERFDYRRDIGELLSAMGGEMEE